MTDKAIHTGLQSVQDERFQCENLFFALSIAYESRCRISVYLTPDTNKSGILAEINDNENFAWTIIRSW